MTHKRLALLRYRGLVVTAALSCSVSGCVSHAIRASTEPMIGVSSILASQQAAWNAGDIEGFMGSYWRSSQLTFVSGGTVTQGWDATLERYRKRYPDRAAMGKLTFSELHVENLSADAALMRGRWHLERAEPVGGMFTLIFRQIQGRWVIVYDHTSTAEK